MAGSQQIDPSYTDLLRGNGARIRILSGICAAGLLIYFIWAAVCLGNAGDRVSNRMRFHAIPVALSALYYGKSHDMTAYRQIAMEFQGSTLPTAALVQKYAEGINVNRDSVRNSGDYYWVADDRGMGDFTLMAFSLFGADLSSLFWFYVLILTAMIVAYAISLRRDELALVILALTISGFIVAVFAGPLNGRGVNAAGFAENLVPIHDSRSFDALALIGLFHILFLALGRIELNRLTWTALGAQVLLLSFLLTARSSVKLGLLFMILVPLVLLIRSCRGTSAKNPAKGKTERIRSLVSKPPTIGLLACLAVGLVSITYQHAAYHPETLKSTRTVWHNILMGIGKPAISTTLAMADDRAAITAVVERHNRMKPDRQWDVQTILNSLGGHIDFDWPAYERTARNLFFSLWAEKPGLMLEWYLYEKPKRLAGLIIGTSKLHLSLKPKNYSVLCPEVCRAELKLLHWPVVVGLLLISVLARRTILRNWVPVALALAAGSFVYILPAIVFYGFLLNILGGIVLISMALYWIAMGIIARFSQKILDRD